MESEVTGQKPRAKSLRASFLDRKRQNRRAASCAGPRATRRFWNKSIVLFAIHVWQFCGNPVSRVAYFNPATHFLQHHELHDCIRTASGTSAMLVERAYKSAIQAFKFFCWMIDRTDQCAGHFLLFLDHPQSSKSFRLAVANPFTLRPCGLLHLLPNKVAGFNSAANWQVLQ